MHIYNRPYYFRGSNAITHSNDLSDILSNITPASRPNILALTCDNGGDFDPESYLVFYTMGRLWKSYNLDQLIITSFALGESKYNFIERSWARYSQALSGVTLVQNAASYPKNDEKIKILMNKALEE